MEKAQSPIDPEPRQVTSHLSPVHPTCGRPPPKPICVDGEAPVSGATFAARMLPAEFQTTTNSPSGLAATSPNEVTAQSEMPKEDPSGLCSEAETKRPRIVPARSTHTTRNAELPAATCTSSASAQASVKSSSKADAGGSRGSAGVGSASGGAGEGLFVGGTGGISASRWLPYPTSNRARPTHRQQ